jgi:hypothetical protein
VKLPFINLDFFFEGYEVGYFETLKFSSNDGEYSYMPYRGHGHYKMWQTIKEKGFAICYFINKKEKSFFKVEDANKYGKLILSEFRKEIIEK